MTTPTTRTFLMLGPGGMAVEVLPGLPGVASFTYALDEGPARAVVHWRSKLTGATGHGEPLPADLAREAADDANRRLPDLEHWTEPTP